MAAFRDILAATPGAKPTIVLSEGADPRVAEAAVAASVANLAKIICIGDPDLVEPALSAAGSAGISPLKILPTAQSCRAILSTMLKSARPRA